MPYSAKVIGLAAVTLFVAVALVNGWRDPTQLLAINSITTPDDIDSARISLKLDASGFPVVSYMANDITALRILHCNDVNCAGGDDSITVPDTFSVGRGTSLVLDSSGNPVVAYGDGDLNVLHCNDPNCDGVGESITSPDTAGTVGELPSLALDGSGNPVVSYYDGTNGDLKLLHCNDANCDGVGESITSPDTGGDVGLYTSLVLDSSGNPVVSYYDFTNGDLKLLHCNDSDCDGAGESITSPDTGGDVGTYTSLALDLSGNPVISYRDETSEDLKVIHCNDSNCDGVGESIVSPDTTGDVGRGTSLVLDANGNPAISYLGNSSLKMLRCNDSDCSSTKPIASPDSGSFATSTALDANGYPVVAYDSSALKLLHCGDATCSSTGLKFTVDSQSDAVDASIGDSNCDDGSGNCTLRAAIQEANAVAGSDSIVVPPGIYGLTIAGAGENSSATGDLDITGDLIITGAGANLTTIDGNDLDRVFQVLSSSTAEISAVTITGGALATAGGGGVRNENGSTLTLTDVAVRDNLAAVNGGGVFNLGTITIRRSTISGNEAPDNGGGIYNDGSALVASSTISNNAADLNGGGIRQVGAGSTLTMSDVTVADNASDQDNNGTGEGGGLSIAGGGPATIGNTLIGGNSANSASGPDCSGTLTSAGYNLVGDDTGCTFTSGTGDLVNINPLIGTLRDNGGTTLTHLIPVVSPAVDSGNPAPPGSGGGACETTDQRGDPRPKDGDNNTIARCDIGAFEATGASEVACPNVPDLSPPDAGCDAYEYTANLTVTGPLLSGPGGDASLYVLNRAHGLASPALGPSGLATLACIATGQIVVDRDSVADVNPANGLDEVDIEVFFLDGYIDCPGPIALGEAQLSSGTVEEKINNTPGKIEFPANIQANLCLEIDTDPDTLFGILENCPATLSAEPLKVTCSVLSLREADCVFGSAGFFDESEVEQAMVDGGTLSLVEISNIGGVAERPDVEAGGVTGEPGSGPEAGSVAGIVGLAAIVSVALVLTGAAWYRRRVR